MFEYQAVIEDEYSYSEDTILSLLDNNKDSLIYLLERGYVKANKGNLLAFSFVGVITVKDILICCYPKYYTGYNVKVSDHYLFDFSNLIKIFKRFNKIDFIPDYDLINTNNIFETSEIVLADKIIKHYIDYGLFNKVLFIRELNSDGEVDWDCTVSSLDPILSKKQVIYHDVYGISHIRQNNNLIQEVQKWAISYSLNKYGKILDYHFLLNEDYITRLEDIGEIEYLQTIIQNELRATYLDRDIAVLKLLIQIISKNNDSSADQFDLYGTGHFHVIWKKICSGVLSNQVDKFKSYLPKPIWFNNANDSVTKETLIPDIIAEKGSRIYIFDAKYYNLKYQTDPYTVSGNPGIGDVSKQFLYALTFQEKYSHIYNLFLFPKIQSLYFDIIGYVEFNLFDSVIHNMNISPQMLFKSFLDNETKEGILDDIHILFV